MSRERTDEQEAAIACRDLDILVEAGAGTGKTTTTVDRYMRLLEEDDENLKPSEILVFTFTDKAANELRERVRDNRQKKLDEGTGGTFSMSTAWIGTFHAVCGSILRSHPLQAGVDPTFEILDDIQADRLKEIAYQSALKEFMSDTGREAMIARFTPSQLQKGVFNAYAQLRSRGQLNPALPEAEPDDGSGLVEGLLEMARAELVSEELTTGQRQKVQSLVDFLIETSSAKISFEELRAVNIGKTSKAFQPLIDAKRKCVARLAAIDFGDDIRAGLGELLDLYGERYAEAKRNANVLDFEDLQIQTVELLRDEDIAAIYRGRFKEIMVDEFQDTNQLQIDLINGLRDPATRLFTVGDEMQAIYGFRHADVRLFRARRKFVEESSTGSLLSLTANFRSQAPVIGAINQIGEELDDEVKSFRNLDDINSPARKVDRHKFSKLQVGLEPQQYEGNEVEMLFSEKEGWAGLDLGPISPAIDTEAHEVSATAASHEAEALLLAQHLKLTLEETGIPASGAVMLFRTKTHMPVFEAALGQVGLNSYVVGGTGFWESREGTEVRSLLATVANPLDDNSLLGSLTSPACGMSSDSLLLLRQAAGFDKPLWPALRELAGDDGPLGQQDRERAARFVSVIDDIRRLAAATPLGELVETVITETGYDLANLTRNPNADGLANVRRISSLASAFEAREGRDLRGLLEWIDLSSRLDTESSVATQEEDSDVVRLMTIHKAKGLQFDIVCVADLGRSGKSNSEPVFWIGPGEPPGPGRPEGKLKFGLSVPQPGADKLDLYDWDELSEISRLEGADEELRLFHVAITRAKHRLVMSGNFDITQSGGISESASVARRLLSAFGIDQTEPESIMVPPPECLPGLKGRPSESQIMIVRSEADPDQAETLRRVGTIEMPAALSELGTPPLKRPRQMSHSNIPLSFSALNEYRECPSQFYATRILRLGEPEEETALAPTSAPDPEIERLNLRNEATRFGTALHEIFEVCAERRWILPTEREVESKLETSGIDISDGEAVERTMGMITGFVDSDLAGRIRDFRADIEIPLLVEIDGVVIRGFADLMIRDLDPPVIIDYKTNRLGDKTPREKMVDYELQRNLYGLAVSRALGTPTVETAFVFLEKADEPVIDLLDETLLEEGRERIARLIGEISSGHFFGGPQAKFQPCGDCWACKSLASQRQRALAA